MSSVKFNSEMNMKYIRKKLFDSKFHNIIQSYNTMIDEQCHMGNGRMKREWTKKPKSVLLRNSFSPSVACLYLFTFAVPYHHIMIKTIENQLVEKIMKNKNTRHLLKQKAAKDKFIIRELMLLYYLLNNKELKERQNKEKQNEKRQNFNLKTVSNELFM